MSSLVALSVSALPFVHLVSANATTPELVVNGTFDSGLAGWTAAGTKTTIKVTTKNVATLSVAHGGQALISDEVPTVTGAKAGAEYTATVRVRGSHAGISGALVVEQAAPGTSPTYPATEFALTNLDWTTVQLPFTVGKDLSDLDIRVRSSVGHRQRLFIDDVSMVLTKAPHPGPMLTNGCAVSQRGIPSCGTLFGAAFGANTDPAAWEQQMGKQLGVRRTFYQASQVAGALRTVKADLAAKRLPWISFKFPHNWADMAAGKGDAWAKDLASQLATVDGSVWIAFHHEPEGDGDIKQWTAIQNRLAPIVRNNAPNVAYSIVLTGYNQVSGPAEYRLDSLWPAAKVDILGVDTYNHYGVVKSGKTQTFHTDFVNKYYKPFQAFAKAKGIDWGIAETGYTDAAAVNSPQWLAQAYNDMQAHGGIAFTYFNTNLNSIANWELSTQLKKQGFTTALKTSPTLK